MIVDIVHDEVKQRRWNQQYAAQQTTATSNRVSVHRNPDGSASKVIYSEGAKFTGLRRGHRWFRWQTRRYVFRLTKSGRMIVTIVSNRPGEKTRSFQVFNLDSVRYLDGDGFGGAKPLVDALGEPKTFNQSYPLAQHFKLNWMLDPGFLAAFESATTAREVSINLYGKRSLRKPLIKVVAQSSVEFLYLSWSLRGRHIPIDWHIDFLRRHVGAELPRLNGVRLRPQARLLDRNTRRLLLRETLTGTGWEIVDFTMMKPNVPITSGKSWADVHDKAVARVRQEQEVSLAKSLRSKPSKEYLEFASHLTGSTVKGQLVVVALDAETLAAWSDHMKNCVAGYIRYVLTGQIILGAVLGVDGNPTANFSIDFAGMRLTQLMGRFNHALPAPDQEGITGFLAEHGVAVDDYIGMPTLR